MAGMFFHNVLICW